MKKTKPAKTKKKKSAKTKKKKSVRMNTDKTFFAKLDKLYERFPYLTDLDLREVFLTENRNELTLKRSRNSELEARRLFDEWLKNKNSDK